MNFHLFHAATAQGFIRHAPPSLGKWCTAVLNSTLAKAKCKNAEKRCVNSTLIILPLWMKMSIFFLSGLADIEMCLSRSYLFFCFYTKAVVTLIILSLKSRNNKLLSGHQKHIFSMIRFIYVVWLNDIPGKKLSADPILQLGLDLLKQRTQTIHDSCIFTSFTLDLVMLNM